jgi:hypothetical protein
MAFNTLSTIFQLYCVFVTFIGQGNQSKPQTCRKSLNYLSSPPSFVCIATFLFKNNIKDVIVHTTGIIFPNSMGFNELLTTEAKLAKEDQNMVIII